MPWDVENTRFQRTLFLFFSIFVFFINLYNYKYLQIFDRFASNWMAKRSPMFANRALYFLFFINVLFKILVHTQVMSKEIKRSQGRT